MPTNPPPDSEKANGYGEIEPDTSGDDAAQGAESRDDAERLEEHNRQASTGTDQTAPD